MTTFTIDRLEPDLIEFELERLETRYSQPMAEVNCAGCLGCSGCGHAGCSGCTSCATEIPPDHQ